MNVLDMLAYGSVLGMGTPEQQRQESLARDTLAQRNRLLEDEQARRRAADAAEERRWKMQYGPVDPGVAAAWSPFFKDQFGIALPQNLTQHTLDSYLRAAQFLAPKEDTVFVHPDTGEELGSTRDRNVKPPTLDMPVQEDFSLPGSAKGPQGPVSDTVPRRAVAVPRSRYVSVLDQIRRRQEGEQKASEAALKADEASRKEADMQAVREATARAGRLIASGVDPNEAKAQEPLADLKALHIENKATAKDKDPTREAMDKLRLKAMQDADRLKQEADTIDEKMARNEAVSETVRNKIANDLTKAAAQHRKFAKEDEDADRTESAQQNLAEAQNLMQRAEQIRSYKPKPQPMAPGGAVRETKAGPTTPKPDQRQQLLTQRDAWVEKLFGPRVNFHRLTPEQKQQVADAISGATR